MIFCFFCMQHNEMTLTKMKELATPASRFFVETAEYRKGGRIAVLTKYGSCETKATGMLLVCQGDKREETAKSIIRQTMWNRRQLLRESCAERDRPTRRSRSPIRLKAQCEHVSLTTQEDLALRLRRILAEDAYIQYPPVLLVPGSPPILPLAGGKLWV